MIRLNITGGHITVKSLFREEIHKVSQLILVIGKWPVLFLVKHELAILKKKR